VVVDFEGVWGPGGNASVMRGSSGSGVVVVVELERPEENELILPHVFERADEDDEEGRSGREPGVNGFKLDCDLNGV
jgi:hypothetical protein